MAETRVSYSVFSAERFHFGIQTDTVFAKIPDGAEILTKTLEAVQYDEFADDGPVAHQEPETYQYVMIDGVEHRYDPVKKVAYRYEYPRDEFGSCIRTKSPWYDLNTKSWVRYMHLLSETFPKDVFEAHYLGKREGDLPPSWNAEEWNCLPFDYKILIESPVNDVDWAEINDSRDPSTVAENPIL